MTFEINASRLSMFFACPARYAFSLKWQRRAPYVAAHLKQGTNVHALMAGTEPPFDAPQPFVQNKMVEEMRLATAGYKWVGEPETKQRVRLTAGLYLNRTIDRMGTFQRRDRIVDWKTANKSWWTSMAAGTGEVISPRAMGFQAKTYLIPPDKPAPFKKAWPTLIEFVVSDGSNTTVHRYEAKPGDRQTLIDAVQLVESATSFPAVRGYGCQWCDFFEMCFETKGYKTKYEPLQDTYQEMDE